MTIQEIYDQKIAPLPPAERLRLATLILINLPPHAVVDYSDDWAEEDMRAASLCSLRRAARSFGEDEVDA